jgi:hypothetical protein
MFRRLYNRYLTTIYYFLQINKPPINRPNLLTKRSLAAIIVYVTAN